VSRDSKAVRRDLERERGALVQDVGAVKTEAETLVAKVRAKLPLIAAAGVAAGVVVALIRRRD
jgi:hypothetical protein